MAFVRASRSLLGEEFPVTKVLVAVNLVIYLFIAVEQGRLVPLGGSTAVAQAWGALSVIPGTLQPWRYLSATFVHYGLVHVGLNCWMLVSFGRSIEESAGASRMLVVFLGGSALGFFASDVYYGLVGQPAHTAGASAGIAGLIGAYIGLAFALRNPIWKRALGSLLIYGVVFAFAMPGQINHMAHIGGLAGGWVLGILFVRERRRRRDAAFRAAAWVLAVLALASIVAARVGAELPRRSVAMWTAK
jgi:rhomboid protease GluP